METKRSAAKRFQGFCQKRGLLTRATTTLLALVGSSACSLSGLITPGEEKPALVVMVSVDQLRADLLTQYDSFFVGGFRRLIDEGAYFDATHNHGDTETGPGHATLSTGVIPARSGIIANDWSERVGDRWVTVYNVQDSASGILGFISLPGRSPQNLVRTGLADWIKDADPRARIVSIGGKDRSAILMAGKAKGSVYWYHQPYARFITSRYYANVYPEWVERFNRDSIPVVLDSVWTERSPLAARALAGPDTAKWEADTLRTFFPHRFREEASGFGNSFANWIGETPYVDNATLALTREAIREERLGRDGVTDFLAVGLSQTDYVGHRFGPMSREQLDNLLNVDRLLGEFFEHLDEVVGRGRWVVGLSADHGVQTAPEWNVARGKQGYRPTRAERDSLNRSIAAAVREATPETRSAAVAAVYRRFPFIAEVYSQEEIERGTPRDSFVTLLRNSYYPGRYGTTTAAEYGLVIRVGENVYMGGNAGAGHGSPYIYDRMVPAIFLGAGVRPGRSSTLGRTVDFAPTLAALAGLTVPADLDGQPLPGVVR